MNHAAKGRRAEHRARAILEGAGYVVVRAAGSRGPFDLVAVNATGLRLIQIKAGGARLSALERAHLAAVPVPAGASTECWRFPPGARCPVVEVIRG